MKRTVLWIIAVGALGVVLSLFVFRGRAASVTTAPGASQAVAAQAAQSAGTTPAGGETIAYTFDDESKMREFTTLWQQRQAFIVRMTVLQGYWNAEQATLATLNSTLQTTYSLDPSKNYTLDSEKRQLIQRPAPEPPAAQAGTTDAPPVETTAAAPAQTPVVTLPAESQVVYSFASDEEMKTFASEWQQRQSIIVRMAVLQAYAREEQTGLAKLNEMLTTTYQLDASRDYVLDGRRRVLIEQPLPAAPGAASPPGVTPTQPASQTAP